MKALILLLSVALVGCKGAAGPTTTADLTATNSSSPTTNFTQNRVDNNAQSIQYSVTNGGMRYYSSVNNVADSTIFTIPEYVNLDTDTLNAVASNDYIELQIANRTFCRYNKVTNYFQFQSCVTGLTSITWTIQANDVYMMSDLNNGAPLAYKDNVIFVLKSANNLDLNGTIEFSYDL